MRLGMFGGEFDPPHIGHLVVCQEARFRLQLDRLLVMPAGLPPHRAPSARTADQRFRMAEAAFAGEPNTEVSRVEIDRQGPSYTVDTLDLLSGDGVELFLVMGADQYASLHTWREADRIRQMATIAVALRPGADRPEGAGIVVESPLLEVSSSELRRRIAAREPVTHLIPEAALEVIRAEGVYRGP